MQPEQASAKQDTLVRRLRERLAALEQIEVSPLAIAAPGGGYYTPGAFGSAWGFGGVGVGLQRRSRYNTGADGAVGVSFGLGNPSHLGLDVGVAILDLRPNTQGRGGFGQRGSFSFKLHRRVKPELAVAAGLENVLNWGGTDVPATGYAVVTRRFRLRPTNDEAFSRASISLGLGSGRFRSEHALATGGSPVGVFANASVSILPSASGFVEWTGQDMGAGITLVPLRSIPLIVTPAVTDLTGSAGDGARWVLGVGYGFHFR